MLKRLTVIAVSIILLLALPLNTLAATPAVAERGIDVSKWQGYNIDWNKVKAAGYTFAILRIGYSEVKDPAFETNYQNAKAAGVKLGVYMYCYAVTTEAAKRDANDVVTWLKGKQLEYPVFYDLEDDNRNLYLGKLTTKQRTDIAVTFVQTMQQKGWYTGVYANKNWYTNYLDTTRLKQVADCTWIAQYPYTVTDETKYFGEYDIWQYSESGSVNGIDGNVDMNVSYTDFFVPIQAGGYNGYNVKPATGVKGDVNGSGQADLQDVVTLARHVAEWSRLPIVPEALNVDESADGIANLNDVVYLARYVEGWYD